METDGLEKIVDFLRAAGFWPWLILLILILLAFRHRITEIKFPGGGGVSLASPLVEVQGRKYDLELRTSDSNVRWSHYVNPDTHAIVPSSQIFARRGFVSTKDFLRFPEHSHRQLAAIQNAIEETADIGKPGVPRRYEITPQSDGGFQIVHYVVLTKLPFPRNHQVLEGDSSKRCTIELRYVRSDGLMLDADKINLTFNAAERYWEQ